MYKKSRYLQNYFFDINRRIKVAINIIVFINIHIMCRLEKMGRYKI